MDLNERFKEPNPIGLNDRFVQSTFQPIDQRKVAPVKTGVVEGIKSLWNPVGETIRDLGAERVGKLLQPDTIVVNGRRQATENKTFNKLSADELNTKLTELTASSPEEADGILYKLKNPTTGEVKYGKAGDDVWTRYGRDAGFQDNWIVEYQRLMKDVDYAERLIHGNKSALEKQSIDFGRSNQSSLNAGGTEQYTKDPLVRDAILKTRNILSEDQKSLADKIWDGLHGKRQDTKALAEQARLEKKDFGKGLTVGISKGLGGVAGLIGDGTAQKYWQNQATTATSKMIDPNSKYAIAGEIAPELMIPAVGNISRGANIAKRIVQGAGSGALLTGGYEALKEQSRIKEGLETNIAMATGVGGVIGGVVGGLTKNPALGKAVGEAFVAGDDKAKEAILQAYPEARGAVDEYFRTNKPVPSTTQPAFKESTVTKSDSIEPEIIQLQKKEIVRPTKEGKITTKAGVEITSEEVKAGKKKIEDVEFQAVNPKDKEGKALSNQTYVPEVNNPMKFKYGYDADGRVYPEESHLLSPQGDATQMASLEQKAKPKIESAEAEVQRRTQFYDTSEALRQRYGQAQASYKESGNLSEKQMEANRLQFEKDQFAEIMRDKSLPKEIQKEARIKLSELNKIEIKDYKPTRLQKEKAKEEELKQHKVVSKSKEAYRAREKELATEYSIYKESRKTRSKEGYETTATKTPDEIVSKITENAKELSLKASKAKKEVEKKVTELGQKFDMANITDEQRRMFRDEIGDIEDIQNARYDLALYKEGKIDTDQLQYREKRRIDERLKREKKDTFKSVDEAKEYRDSIKKQYEDIGIYVKDDEVKVDMPKEKSGKAEKLEAKAKRETKEIEDSKTKHSSVVKALEEYQRTKEVPRYRTTEKAGQKRLTDTQMKQVDEGVLTLDEIADQSAPIGKLEDIEEMKVEAKKKASYLGTEAKQKELGLEWKTRPKDIRFKDTLQDVSNSVGQITAVLLGSKRLSALTKIGGTKSLRDSLGKLKELRNELGLQMEKNGVKKPIVIKDGKELGWKDLIKPTFMTKNYGQEAKGLIRNLQKDFGFSKQYAEKFLAEYEKAFGQLAPEMKELASRLKESFLKSDGVVKYDMPDGFPVRFQVKKKLDGSYSIKGENNPIKIETNSIDEFSTGILPNVIQSADSFIARYMNKHGIVSKHDAFMTPVGKTDAYVRRIYGQAMAELNKHDVLGKIFESLGDTKGSPKIGDLKSTDIKLSARRSEALEPEEIAGMVTKADAREIDLSKVNKSKTEIMKEFMAKDNVRQISVSQLPKALAHESGLRTMSVAKSGDDVYERQFALAHQSPNYNSRQSLKAPQGVDKAEWDKTQREIFAEARARLENNPLLNGVIQGERKYFTETGKVIGDKTKTYQELLREEIVKGNLEIRRLNREAKKAVKQIAPTYERLQMKVKSWEVGKQLNHAEAMAKEVVHNARQLTPVKSTFKRNIDKVKAYFKDQVSDSKVSKDFQKLLSYKVSREGNVAERAESLKKDLDTKFKGHKQEDLNDAILRTDYHAIQELKSADEADAFMREHDNIYQSAKEYIDQSAKAIGEASEQIGFFRNNAKAIADELDLPSGIIPIIDKMISIKAMTPKAWKKIAEIRDTEDFRYAMEIIGSNKERSAKLFGSNPNQQVKGYVSEVYNKPLRIEGDKVKYDADTTREDGAIPNTLERKKVGRYQEKFPKGDFKTLQEKSKFAQENKLKVTENGSFRKVADAELKDKAGRSKSFSEILTKTTQSIDAKETQQLIAKNIIDEMVKGNEMFSQTPKEGYRLIEDNEVSAMPKVVGDSLAGRYVLEAYDKRLFGRDEVRLYNGTSQVGKIADRLIKNTVMHFKQNVILKNPKSYVNATLVNQLLATSAGVNPVKLLKYQKQAIDEIKITDALKEKIAILKARGQNAETLEKELEKSLLYKMEQAGLAINKLEVAGDDATLLGQIMSDMSFGKLDRLGNEAYLSQKSVIGKPAFKLFSIIDTQGRYTIAKNAMDNGKTLEEAVQEANGLFSDMGQMAPAFIELMDKYPFIPFMKWASLTIPRLMKLTKENPVKALALGMVVYGMQIESQKDFSTVNPLEAVVNFGDDAVTLEYLNAVNEDGFGEATKEKIKTFYTPKVYEEIVSELERPDEHDWILKDQIKGRHQPLTQKIVEGE